MEMKYIFALIFVALLVGCSGKVKNGAAVVDTLPDDVQVEEKEVAVETKEVAVEVKDSQIETNDDLEGLSTQEMIDKLSKEAGLEVAEENVTNTTEDNATVVSSNGIHEVILEDLTANPDLLVIDAGDTVTFTSKQKNYKHIIIIRSLDEDTYRDQVGGPFTLLYTDSVNFTFTEPGVYDFYSKPAYDKVNGDITVR